MADLSSCFSSFLLALSAPLRASIKATLQASLAATDAALLAVEAELLNLGIIDNTIVAPALAVAEATVISVTSVFGALPLQQFNNCYQVGTMVNRLNAGIEEAVPAIDSWRLKSLQLKFFKKEQQKLKKQLEDWRDSCQKAIDYIAALD